MKLQFVELCGFRGFREKTRFEFPNGFTVLSGRNGAGKSTVLDAIDYALTGTINKFSVKEAKGGGLDDHIWWVGPERPNAHFVSVGFVDDHEETLVVTRTREGGSNVDVSQIIQRLCKNGPGVRASVQTLLQTTLIRDEFIASLSLDLPEQTRFNVVREAIGNLVGPDYSARAATIVTAANAAKSRQEGRIKELQSELGRFLGQLTEARSAAERSTDISEALRFIESQSISLPADLAERTVALRKIVTDRKAALKEIEQARILALGTLEELAFFGSPQGNVELGSAREALEKATRDHALAEERLTLATRVDQVERESDEYAAHISALLEHGSAVGLREGHCPLCDAARTPAEFEQAVASARVRLASRGEKLEAAAKSLAEAQRFADSTSSALSVATAHLKQLDDRKSALERTLSDVRENYTRYGFSGSPDDPLAVERAMFAEQETLVRLERAPLSCVDSNTK